MAPVAPILLLLALPREVPVSVALVALQPSSASVLPLPSILPFSSSSASSSSSSTTSSSASTSSLLTFSSLLFMLSILTLLLLLLRTIPKSKRWKLILIYCKNNYLHFAKIKYILDIVFPSITIKIYKVEKFPEDRRI